MNYSEEQVSAAMEGLPALWIQKYQIKNESGIPLDFSKRKFLWDIYNDLSPKQALLKPPQIGATVMSMLKSMWVAKKLHKDIIYTLPTATDVNDIVGGSVNRIIVQNSILREWVKDHDTVEQKSVGNNLIRYRGTFSPKQATMVPSSLNIHDEVDNSDEAVLTLYQTRLEAQDDESKKWRWYFSHPSLAGHGVDIYWQQSDKKEWYVTCKECEEEQVLSWPESIDIERQCYVCKSCGSELADSCRINGQWKNQDGVAWAGQIVGEYEFSGWHVSQLMLYNKSAKDIIDAYNDPQKDKQYFYNYVLGLPFIGSEDTIEPSIVLRNCVDQVNPQTARVVIGADTGHGIHYVMMNEDGVFYYDHETEITASKDPYDVIRGHLKRFARSVAIFDQGGDLIGVRKLREEFPGRVFLCFYRKDRKSADIIKWGEGDKWGEVVVDRNRMMTLTVEQLRDTGRVRLNGTKEEWEEFASHYGNMYREKISVKETRERDNSELYGSSYVWKRNGPDHYCFVAGTKVMTGQGEIPIEKIKVGDYVATRNGLKRVYNAGITKKNVRVVTAYFSNGSHFTATPEHPVIHTKGKERLDSVTRHAILYEWNQNLLNTTVLPTEDTHKVLGGRREFTSSLMGLKEQKEQRGFISKYGLMLMEQFLKGMSYIILTVIRSIINFQTWCANHAHTTKAITPENDFLMSLIEFPMQTTLRRSGSFPMLGGVLLLVKNGIPNMLKGFWYLNRGALFALSAILRVLHEARKAVSSVPTDVVIVGFHENIERKDVINVSVEETPEYFANGILVSNCHSLLYAMVGMQKFGTSMARVVGDDVMGVAPLSNSESLIMRSNEYL